MKLNDIYHSQTQTRTISEGLIDTLRSEYSKINTIDPDSPTYKALIKLLDGLDEDRLKVLARADIKFVSKLAQNRIRTKVKEADADKGHGSPYDRGSADAYYGRGLNPHKKENGRTVQLTDPQEIEQYVSGYKGETGRKVWEAQRGRPRKDAPKPEDTTPRIGRIEKTATGIKHYVKGEDEPDNLASLNKSLTSRLDKALGINWKKNTNDNEFDLEEDAAGVGRVVKGVNTTQDVSVDQVKKNLKAFKLAEQDQGCPPATQDIKLNLENRQTAIDEYGYGPLNPEMPNNKFWQKKVDMWNLDSAEEAKGSRCGNCAAFDVTTKTLDCIAKGIGTDEGSEDPYDVVNAGDLGYCRFLKFKCAASRTCDAWVTGGPVTDETVEEGLRDPKDNPCWKGYYPVGTKKKDGRTVPNCVPKESLEEVDSDEGDRNPMAVAVHRRIMRQNPQWFTKYGVDAIEYAIDEIVGEDWDGEMIYADDVSDYIDQLGQYLRDHYGSREEMNDRRPFAEQGVSEEVDTGEYDARKTQPSGKKEQDKIFAKHKERVKALNAKDDKKQGVAEGAPELLKAEMPLVRHIERELAQHGYEKGTEEYKTMFNHALAFYRKFGNVDAIKKGVMEVAPPGMEDWIRDRKADFKKRYGDRWQQVLYATAWKRKKNESLEESIIDEFKSYKTK